ncbi:MAG: hypothetical protein BSOLF_0483 [Candidatus Carbobacillus altaicus]|uniref:Uncharacterized protein n=1 Tax=Candidatus Carbonibacillus altaicus TaxID=2163959 RepID=A0A2R6Y0V1_9BACL|nr:MAG: hypothetical protein BSOLF_0483 [Candidatus Carbobacillus altaicus]
MRKAEGVGEGIRWTERGVPRPGRKDPTPVPGVSRNEAESSAYEDRLEIQ